MTDETLDPRLARALLAYSNGAIRPIDAMAVAEAAMGPAVRSRISRTALVRLALVAAVVLASIGAAFAVVASRPRTTEPVPSPVAPAPGAISATGAMTLDRPGHAAVALQDGRVLVVGGVVGGVTLDTAELWDPATGAFTPAGYMTRFRGQPTAVRLDDGRVLVVDGDSAELYDPRSGSFSATGSMLADWGPTYGDPPRVATLLADGRVFVAPGSWNEPALGANIYDPATGTFTQTAGVPCGLVRTVARLRDGRVLITCLVTRYGAAGDPSAVIYDPATDTYAETGAPTTRNTEAAVLLPDGRVLLAGVRAERASGPVDAAPSLSTDALDIYDPSTGTFASVPMAPALISNAVGLGDGRVLLIGPTAASIFDPESATITPMPGSAGSHADSTVTLLQDGRVLIVGSDTVPGTSTPAIVLDPSLLPSP